MSVADPLLRVPLRSIGDDDLTRLLIAANRELTRRAELDRCWCTLDEGAAKIGISKGSVHHAISEGHIRARRLLPLAESGRASVVLLLHLDDVERYVPRAYPRGKARKAKVRA